MISTSQSKTVGPTCCFARSKSSLTACRLSGWQRLSRRYPAMHRGYGRGGYGALYAITPDWHPILDRCPGLEGAYCAVGFSGHGFKMSPIVGQLMAELVVDGGARALDVAPLRLARFEEKDPVTTPYAYGVMG